MKRRSSWLVCFVIGFGCASAPRGGADAPQPAQASHASTPPVATPRAFRVRVEGTGRPMLLIPGLSCSGDDVWQSTIEHFRGSYQLHVFTLAGFAGEPSVDGPFMDRVRADVIAYIRANQLDHPIIVGHSIGGFLAFWIAATAADAVGPVIAVDGVPFLPALMDPTATLEGSRAPAQAMHDMLARMTADQFAAQNRASLAAMITDPNEVERIAATSSKSDPKAVATAVHELMTTDLRGQIGSIRAPVLLIAAGDEAKDDASRRAVTARYEDQIRTIPVHRVVVAPQARHFIMLDAPAFLFATIEQFLAEHKPGK
ncbi:MAG: alpha/beta fold hydrolase [Kofleriaceae bacterium]